MIFYKGKLQFKKQTSLMWVYSNETFRGVYVPRSIFSEAGLSTHPETITLRITAKLGPQGRGARPQPASAKGRESVKRREVATKLKK